MRKFFSLEGVFTTRNLAVMALMVALTMILNRFSIFLTPTMRLITFNFLPWAVTAVLFGPWAALIVGLLGDTMMFWLNPVGVYFPGYALSAMAEGFLYACFLHQKPITIQRVFICRVLITVFIELGLGYLWNSILYGMAAGVFFTGFRFVVRAAMIPVYTAIVYFTAKAALEIDRRSLRQFS